MRTVSNSCSWRRPTGSVGKGEAMIDVSGARKRVPGLRCRRCRTGARLNVFESLPRQEDHQASYLVKAMVRGGIEPPTFRFSGVVAAQLAPHHASAPGRRRSVLLAVGCCCCCHRCCHFR